MKSVILIGLIFLIAGCASQSNTSIEGTIDDGKDLELVGLAFTALQELNVPIECDITIQDAQENDIDARLSMKGQSFRVEYESQDSPLGGEGCGTLVSILHNQKAYVGCEPIDTQEQCNWLEIDLSESEQSQGSVSTSDLEDKGSAEFSCRPALFGEEKFEVSGNTCNLAEMMEQVFEGFSY